MFAELPPEHYLHLEERECAECGEKVVAGCWCDEPAEVIRGHERLLIHAGCIREDDQLA